MPQTLAEQKSELTALEKLLNNDVHLTTIGMYVYYTKLTHQKNVDVTFTGLHYGYAIDNIYNQYVATPDKIVKEAHDQIKEAEHDKKNLGKSDFYTDVFVDTCKDYYFWIKYPESSKHSGPDEFRKLSQSDRIKQGYQLMIKDAHKMLKRIKEDQKNGNGLYYYISNRFLNTRYQVKVNKADISFTVDNMISKLIFSLLKAKKHFPDVLAPRETKAIFDTQFQHDLVKLNWAKNWADVGSPNTLEDMNLTKQRAKSIQNAQVISEFANQHQVKIPTKDIFSKKVFKYNIKDAKRFAKAHQKKSVKK